MLLEARSTAYPVRRTTTYPFAGFMRAADIAAQEIMLACAECGVVSRDAQNLAGTRIAERSSSLRYVRRLPDSAAQKEDTHE